MLELENLARREYSGRVSWIAPAGVSESNGCHFRARRSFAPARLSGSRLYIAAESYYSLWINGQEAGSGPARGTIGCNFADEYDLSAYLNQPTLNVGVEVFCNNFPTFIAAPAEPAVFISVGDSASDASWQVQIAEDWRDGDVPNYTFQIGLAEWRDYRKYPTGWQMFKDDSAWQEASVIDPARPIYAKKLFHRDVAPMEVSRILPTRISEVYGAAPAGELTPEQVAEVMTGEGYFPLELDLGALCDGGSVVVPPQPSGGSVVMIVDPQQAYIGGFELDVEAVAGTVIDVGNDEGFVDGRLVFKRGKDYRQVDRYIHGGGRHVVGSQLHYRGGRFLQFVFRDFDTPITLHRLEFVDSRYPIGEPARFECDNPGYNEIWKRCVHTMSTCATDTFIDCPWREQAFWVNDFIVQSIYWLELTGSGELIRRSLDLAMSQRIDEGLIPGVCPFDGKKVHVLFATNLFLPIILLNYLKYTGDGEYVASVLPTVVDIFNSCQKYADENGLLNPSDEFWNFVDWGYLLQDPAREEYPLNDRNTCVVNWFNVLACNALAELSVDASESEKYCRQAADIAIAIEKKFWNSSKELFYEWLGDSSGPAESAGSLTHSLALLSGRLSPGKRDRVAAALAGGGLYHPELYMLHFVMEALSELGEDGQVSAIIDKYWSSMLGEDTPAIWEANVYKHGKEALWGLGSLCHAFALSPVNNFQKYILGIKPLENGFSRFLFSPNIMDLMNVSGTIPTPHGLIVVELSREEDECVKVRITVPMNTVAVLSNSDELFPGVHGLSIRSV